MGEGGVCEGEGEAAPPHTEPATIVKACATPTVRSEAGADVTLTCPISGIPLPSVTWTKDGVVVATVPGRVELFNDSQELTISDARLDDGGTYMCRVVNTFGEDSYTIDLQVLGEPGGRPLTRGFPCVRWSTCNNKGAAEI